MIDCESKVFVPSLCFLRKCGVVVVIDCESKVFIPSLDFLAGPAWQYELHRVEHRGRRTGEQFDESRQFDSGLCRAEYAFPCDRAECEAS